MKLFTTISEELESYLTKSVEISEGVLFSEYKLKKRIALFENQTYPKGKADAQKKYKYWFDIITPRRDAEVKNIDFDTREVFVHSEEDGYEVCDLITNLKLRSWLKDTGQAKELNDAVEEFSGWGNILFKKSKKGYARCDLKNTFVINTTAECVDETPIIERFLLTQSDLRAKNGVWKNIPEVIEKCKDKSFSRTMRSTDESKTIPYYEVFERNGELSVAELTEAQGGTPKEGDEDKYVLAKVVIAGVDNGGSGYVLFAESFPSSKKMSDFFVEGHRGPYKGRWFREGMYELLFECQTRANEIGNQLARGLEYASKKLWASRDRQTMQNVITGARNGDILRGEFQNLDTRMDGFDQLIADWNRNLAMANEIANSREVVQGASQSQQPFRLGALLNQNANKLFDFIREKLTIPFNILFERWIVPTLISEMKAEDYVKLQGEGENYDRFIDLIVNGWYLQNLVDIGPHTSEVAQFYKQREKDKLKQRPELVVELTRKFWASYKPKVTVDITGEGTSLDLDLQSAATFLPFMADPVTRDDLVTRMMKKKLRWLDVDSLKKSAPAPVQAQQPINPTTVVPQQVVA